MKGVDAPEEEKAMGVELEAVQVEVAKWAAGVEATEAARSGGDEGERGGG